jgi:hypothetical protein
MNKFILFFAFAALCFTGCKKDVVPPPDPGIGVENPAVTPYRSVSRVSTLNKVVAEPEGKSPADTVRISTDQVKTYRGTVE